MITNNSMKPRMRHRVERATAAVIGEGLPVEEIAKKIGTIHYEILCAVGKRVPRIYIR